jgi:hypothetical protein
LNRAFTYADNLDVGRANQSDTHLGISSLDVDRCQETSAAATENEDFFNG